MFPDTLRAADAIARRLAPYPVVVAIRERTWFPAALLSRLPALRLLALAGPHTGQVDLTAAAERGVVVTETEGSSSNAFEHTIALLSARLTLGYRALGLLERTRASGALQCDARWPQLHQAWAHV